MMSSLLGAAASETLEDGRVVSGVGGQYNFVAMAHELPDGRSILLQRATRHHRGGVETNIRWHYGQTTIPRHLRDLVVSEYGVADLRGKSDNECIEAMLAISDARFVDALAAEAKAHGKLAADFKIPEAWRRHRPEMLEEALAEAGAKGLLPRFPFGSDFTEVELRLLSALTWLQTSSATWRGRWGLFQRLLRPGEAVAEESVALERMQLGAPAGVAARLQQRLLLAALRTTAAGAAQMRTHRPEGD
jgi:hypothetical protein